MSASNIAASPSHDNECLKWQPIQLRSSDLKFLARREFSIAEISRWFNAPIDLGDDE